MLAPLAAALLLTAPGTPAPFESSFLGGGWPLRDSLIGGDYTTMVSTPLSEESDCRLSLDFLPGLQREDDWSDGPIRWVGVNGHRERSGEWVIYQHILRGADRPYAYSAYETPVAGFPVTSPFDLDQPDAHQRRDAELSATGHGGIDVAAPMGTLIRMVTLDRQVGPAEVLYVGHLFGTSVVTHHQIREGTRLRDYVVIFGHLDQPAEGLRRGVTLDAGDIVGTVGDSDSPGRVHLHFEARRMRQGVDPWTVPGPKIDEREFSVVSDPRNVLPLRSVPRPSSCRPNFVPARPRHVALATELVLEDPFEDPTLSAAASFVGWDQLATVLRVNPNAALGARPLPRGRPPWGSAE